MVVRARTLFRVSATTIRIVLVQVDHVNNDEAIGQTESCFYRISKALAHTGTHHEPVNDDLDRVAQFLFQNWSVLESNQFAVDDRTRVAGRLQLIDQVLIFTLASTHDRRQNLETRSLIHGTHSIHNLLGSLRLNACATLRAVSDPRTRVQQTQVVVNLSNRANRGTRVARCRLLVNRDRGRQTLDEIDVGFVHLTEELARVRRQRLHVSTLALCEDRIECQR